MQSKQISCIRETQENNGIIMMTTTWCTEQKAINATAYESNIIYPWFENSHATKKVNQFGITENKLIWQVSKIKALLLSFVSWCSLTGHNLAHFLFTFQDRNSPLNGWGLLIQSVVWTFLFKHSRATELTHTHICAATLENVAHVIKNVYLGGHQGEKLGEIYWGRGEEKIAKLLNQE